MAHFRNWVLATFVIAALAPTALAQDAVGPLPPGPPAGPKAVGIGPVLLGAGLIVAIIAVAASSGGHNNGNGGSTSTSTTGTGS